VHAFRDIETAAYCPRKLYYRRRDPETEQPPDSVEKRRTLAFEYEQLLRDDQALNQAPIAVTPTQYRSSLGCARASVDCWEELIAPVEENVFLEGRECHGIAHKLLDTEPASLSLAFTGAPPEQGVWEPQSVRLMAGAKALSWEYETDVERVFAEYPAYGIIRPIAVDARRTATYRAAVRTADAIDGPPAKTNNRSKCRPCEYRDQCGVRTRTLGSLLGSD
jgi:CRISPR-associated exonuclease Cas4